MVAQTPNRFPNSRLRSLQTDHTGTREIARLNLPFKFGSRLIKTPRFLSRKGQMKIQQMMFMILAVTFLFILVGVFFLAISLQNLKNTASTLGGENAKLLVSKLANSPEFFCGNSFGAKTSCVDFDKVMILKDMSEYSNFWGVAKIEIRKIFPNRGDTLCNAENYPDCGVVNVLDRKVNALPPSSTFISLCKKEKNERIIYNNCELALLIVSSEDKRTTT
jgi:hypothetical protein